MRAAHQFTIAGRTYRAARMSARTQLHVARRVTPILASFMPSVIGAIRERAEAVRQLRESGVDPASEAAQSSSALDLSIETIMPGVSSAAEMLARMPDAEFDYVQAECLSLVERQKAGDTGWIQIWNRAAGQPQFDDIEGHELILIMVEVLKVEVVPFFLGLVGESSSAAQSTASRL